MQAIGASYFEQFLINSFLTLFGEKDFRTYTHGRETERRQPVNTGAYSFGASTLSVGSASLPRIAQR